MADLRADEGEAVVEELRRALVEQRHAVIAVGVDLHAGLCEAVHDKVALEMVAVVGHGLRDLAHEQLAADDEQAHGGKILLACAVVDGHVRHAVIRVDLHGQIELLLPVADAVLHHDGDVRARGGVGLDDLFQIDGAQHAAVGQNDIFLRGDFQEIHGGIQRLELAPVAAVVAHGKRRQEFQAALTELEVPLLPGADVVHEGLIIVLRDDADMADGGIRHVRQGEIDLTIAPAVGQGRHGALVRQLTEGAVIDIRKDDAHRSHGSSPPSQ